MYVFNISCISLVNSRNNIEVLRHNVELVSILYIEKVNKCVLTIADKVRNYLCVFCK